MHDTDRLCQWPEIILERFIESMRKGSCQIPNPGINIYPSLSLLRAAGMFWLENPRVSPARSDTPGLPLLLARRVSAPVLLLSLSLYPWPGARNIRGLLSLSQSQFRCHQVPETDSRHLECYRSIHFEINQSKVTRTMRKLKPTKNMSISFVKLWLHDCWCYDANMRVCDQWPVTSDQAGHVRWAWQCFAFTEHRGLDTFLVKASLSRI